MTNSTGLGPLVHQLCRGRRPWVALVCGIASGLLTAVAGPVEAAPRYSGYSFYHGYYVAPRYVPVRKPRLAAPARKAKAEKEASFGELPKGPLQVLISVHSQRVTLFANGERVAQGPVSTGTASHPTPLGIFSILEKNRHHRSNIYANAPMPYMQRLTWSGVALHEGVLPGYPASHGCIRLSNDFARKLWPVTRLGVRVVVAREDLAPRPFEHAKLFVPKQKPSDQVAANPGVERLVRFAQAAITDAGGPKADDAGSLAAGERVEMDETRPAPLPQETTTQPVADADETEPSTGGNPVDTVRAGESGEGPALASDAVAAPPPAPAGADLRRAVQLPTGTDPSSESPQSSATTHVPVVADEVKPAPVIDPAKPQVPPRAKAADQPVKRSGQLAVFVSRKEKRIFIRQGSVPLFDMPVAIQEPDQPLGTHLFTAMGFTDGEAGMRWNLITVPSDMSPVVERARTRRGSVKEPPPPSRPVKLRPPSTAAEALDRIQMPPEAVDRIAELLIPGSSLVISDEGLGRETGRQTEFIVLTR